MSFSARVVLDSVTPAGFRLTTMALRYPRMIHAEFMTHRVFSRNASSSRAIPVNKIIQQVIDDPAMPVYFGKNQKGMQAREELSTEEIAKVKEEWLAARDFAVAQAQRMVNLNLHKQIANRVLEPFHHIDVVVSSTDWKNYFALRCHPDAQPEMRHLSELMREVYLASVPIQLGYGPDSWHLPFISEEERTKHSTIILRSASVARCARVSYQNHDGTNPDIAKDIVLHDQLLESKHMSPFEHQGNPLRIDTYSAHGRSPLTGNFRGWIQYRKLIQGENQES